LIPDLIDEGVELLNPVQTAAADMDPKELNDEYGDKLTFWGGGIETQSVLVDGTPDEVAAMAKERIEIFGPGGGYVFNQVHNIQAGVPPANIIAMYEAAKSARGYPLAQS
jgi:uroporphyrinogen decarboxylase